MTMNKLLKRYSVRVLVASVVLLFPVMAGAVGEVTPINTSFTVFSNSTYKVTGTLQGAISPLNSAGQYANVSSLNFQGVSSDTVFTARGVDITGVSGREPVLIQIKDGNKVLASGLGEAKIEAGTLQSAKDPQITARASTAQGQREGLDFNKKINVGQNSGKELPFLTKQDPAPQEYGGTSNSQSGQSPSDLSGGGSSSGKKLVPCDGTDCSLDLLKQMGVNIFNYIIGFGGLVAVLAIVVTGFQYISSRGDSGAMSDAKKKLTVAITGLVILAASALIVNTVMKWLDVNGNVVPSKVEDVK